MRAALAVAAAAAAALLAACAALLLSPAPDTAPAGNRDAMVWRQHVSRLARDGRAV